ncbi:hypothetical protein SASPL_136062 [Salvia splendens]|uniref:SOSEKI DIX-like domain-containing protein n=1 Tax=Salvia splendens TaxID=180675 RepID=A0A8X8ZH63_SALSN|nr:hypothetical protein SASPL_136062 [Salvia splendens]
MRYELTRSYKNGFVWHDLSEDDLIIPAHGHDYILKDRDLPTTVRFEPRDTGHVVESRPIGTLGPGAGGHLTQLTGRPPEALCGHLTQLEDVAAYESAFAVIHHQRLNWIPILQMQTYFSIADVTAELKKVVEKKISENDAEVNKAQGDCAATIDGEETQKDNNHHNFQQDLEIETT